MQLLHNWMMPQRLATLAIALTLTACGSGTDPARMANDARHEYKLTEEKDREAGFEWAKQNGEIDPIACDRNSQAFKEGCDTWISLRLQSSEHDADAIEQND